MARCLNYFYYFGVYILFLLPCSVSGDIDAMFKVLSWRLDDVLTETNNLKLKIDSIGNRVKHMEEKLQDLQTTPKKLNRKVDNINNRVKNMEEKLQELHVHTTTPNAQFRIEDEIKDLETKLNENLQMQAMAIEKMLSKEKQLLRQSTENFTATFAELKSEIQTQMSVFNVSFEEERQSIGIDFDHLKSAIRLEMNEYNNTLSVCISNISQVLQTTETNMASNIQEIEKRIVVNIKTEQNETLLNISSLQADVQSLSTIISNMSNTLLSESTPLSSQMSSYSKRIYRLEERIFKCASNPCLNNATCIDEFNSYSCKCLMGYSGTNCEIVLCSEACKENGATCVIPWECVCPTGKYGRFCELTSNKINVGRKEGVDVYLIVDVSRSIDNAKLEATKRFIFAMLPVLDINDGDRGTRLAVYYFASIGKSIKSHFDSYQYESYTEAQELINSTLHKDEIRNTSGSGTGIARTLNYIVVEQETKFILEARGKIRHAQQVIILISDGTLVITTEAGITE